MKSPGIATSFLFGMCTEHRDQHHGQQRDRWVRDACANQHPSGTCTDSQRRCCLREDVSVLADDVPVSAHNLHTLHNTPFSSQLELSSGPTSHLRWGACWHENPEHLSPLDQDFMVKTWLLAIANHFAIMTKLQYPAAEDTDIHLRVKTRE
jgi:hypothetical protein